MADVDATNRLRAFIECSWGKLIIQRANSVPRWFSSRRFLFPPLCFARQSSHFGSSNVGGSQRTKWDDKISRLVRHCYWRLGDVLQLILQLSSMQDISSFSA